MSGLGGIANWIEIDARGLKERILELRLPPMQFVPPPFKFQFRRPPMARKGKIGKELAKALARVAGLGSLVPHAVVARLIVKGVTAFAASAITLDVPAVARLTRAMTGLAGQVAIAFERIAIGRVGADGSLTSWPGQVAETIVGPIVDGIRGLVLVGVSMAASGATGQLAIAASGILARANNSFTLMILRAIPGVGPLAFAAGLAGAAGAGVTLTNPVGAEMAARDFVGTQFTRAARSAFLPPVSAPAGFGFDRAAIAAGVAELMTAAQPPLSGQQRFANALDQFKSHSSWRVLSTGGGVFDVLSVGLDSMGRHANDAIAAFGTFNGTLPERVKRTQAASASFVDAMRMDLAAAKAVSGSGKNAGRWQFIVIAVESSIRGALSLAKAITKTIALDPSAAFDYAAASLFLTAGTLASVAAGTGGFGFGPRDADVSVPSQWQAPREAVLFVNVPGYSQPEQIGKLIRDGINANATQLDLAAPSVQNATSDPSFGASLEQALARQFLESPDKAFVVTSLPALIGTLEDVSSAAADEFDRGIGRVEAEAERVWDQIF